MIPLAAVPAFLLLAAGVLHAASPERVAASAKKTNDGEHVPAQLWRHVTPRADHHQHLFSPEAAKLIDVGRQPEVELPAELSQLLRQREARWNDEPGLQDLFAPDVLVFDQTWILGREAGAKHLSTRFSGPFRMLPVAYRTESLSPFIAGYVTRGDGAETRFISQFYVGLVRSRAGQWRIGTEASTLPFPPDQPPITADRLVQMLNLAGIERAAVLSEGFWFDSPPSVGEADVYRKVREENDWTVREAARYPDRLMPFCSFNPLRDYALNELRRCAENPRVKGLKLSFGASGVDLRDSDHVAKVREVFQEADRLSLAIVAHVRDGQHYGRKEAQTFVDEILSAAPNVPVQIAHLWGGEGFSADALAVYAQAVSSGSPATENLYFDVAEIAVVGASEEEMQIMANRMRQIGMDRMLYGSDAAFIDRLPPQEAWKAFVSSIPLTVEEFTTIAENVAPYW